MLRTVLLLLAMTSTMISCASGPRTPETPPQPCPVLEPKVVTVVKEVDHACDWTAPITFTYEQAKLIPKPVLSQIIQNNEMGAKKCGWVPPGAKKAGASKPASK